MAEVEDRAVPTRAQFFVRTDGPVPLIEIAGEIDLANEDAFAGCLSVFNAQETVMLDLSRLEYIDSRGISVLAATHNRGVNVVCRGAHGIVLKALELCGMTEVLTMDERRSATEN
jgi:anti-anti-sigma factor